MNAATVYRPSAHEALLTILVCSLVSLLYLDGVLQVPFYYEFS